MRSPAGSVPITRACSGVYVTELPVRSVEALVRDRSSSNANLGRSATDTRPPAPNVFAIARLLSKLVYRANAPSSTAPACCPAAGTALTSANTTANRVMRHATAEPIVPVRKLGDLEARHAAQHLLHPRHARIRFGRDDRGDRAGPRRGLPRRRGAPPAGDRAGDDEVADVALHSSLR